MIFYSYEEFKEDVKILAKEIKEDFNPDALLAIARGGDEFRTLFSSGFKNASTFCFKLNSLR